MSFADGDLGYDCFCHGKHQSPKHINRQHCGTSFLEYESIYEVLDMMAPKPGEQSDHLQLLPLDPKTMKKDGS